MAVDIFWRLGFRQSSFRLITRVPQSTVPNVWTRSLVSWHALVPFTFRIQVSHQTQEPPSEFLPAEPGIRQAPRGALEALDLAAGLGVGP
jgi:hypothetical protein